MLKVTDIKDASIRFSNDTPYIYFKTDDGHYHCWLKKIDGVWQINGKLIKRLSIDNREKPTATLDPLNKTNGPIIRYLISTLDIENLDAKLKEVQERREAEHLAHMNAMIGRQAKLIRETFKKLSSKERVNHLKIAYDVLANHPDDKGLVDLARKLNKAREDAE